MNMSLVASVSCRPSLLFLRLFDCCLSQTQLERPPISLLLFNHTRISCRSLVIARRASALSIATTGSAGCSGRTSGGKHRFQQQAALAQISAAMAFAGTTTAQRRLSNMAAQFQGTNAAIPGSQPVAVGTIDIQVTRALARLRSIPGDLEKYTYLQTLKSRSEDVFYCLVLANLSELTPIIYTPVIGLACQNFSLIHPPTHWDRQTITTLYLSALDKDRMPEIIAGLNTRRPKDQMVISVVTDGSRVLGLGDLGVGGLGISQGKLSLYVAAGGIDPKATLPIILDLGTNNERLLADPLYVGLRQRRMEDEDAEAFVEIFMREMHKNFPNMLIQFEDFHTTLAFPLLEKHRHVYPCFNDDISGTGCVILGGLIRAFQMNGRALKDQRIVFFGAGSSGVGVAETICRWLVLQGIDGQSAKNMFWLVDSKGLVANNRGDKLPSHKQYLSRSGATEPRLETLIDVVKPTALLGLSTVGGTFTTEILQEMATVNRRPIVFPLSNPVAQAECTFDEAVTQTDGRVLFASGSPFDPVTYKGKTMFAGQGNNLYAFPPIGLGSILCRAKEVTDDMIIASAEALPTSMTEAERERNLLYPELDRIRDVTVRCAVAVIRAAQKAGVDRNESLRSMDDNALLKFVQQRMWHPLLTPSAQLRPQHRAPSSHALDKVVL